MQTFRGEGSRARVADLLDLALAIGALLSLIDSALQHSFLFLGGPLTATIIGSVMSYLLVSRSLRGRGLWLERIPYAFAATASGIWLYEIVYHYAYLNDISAIPTNLLTFNIDTGTGTYFPLLWALMVVCVVFTGVRFMRLNRWFYASVIFSCVVFVVWVLCGYPQWVYPGSYFTPRLFFVPSDQTELYGFVFNSLTKVAVVSTPATLYLRRAVKSGLQEGKLPSGETGARVPLQRAPGIGEY